MKLWSALMIPSANSIALWAGPPVFGLRSKPFEISERPPVHGGRGGEPDLPGRDRDRGRDLRQQRLALRAAHAVADRDRVVLDRAEGGAGRLPLGLRDRARLLRVDAAGALERHPLEAAADQDRLLRAEGVQGDAGPRGDVERDVVRVGDLAELRRAEDLEQRPCRSGSIRRRRRSEVMAPGEVLTDLAPARLVRRERVVEDRGDVEPGLRPEPLVGVRVDALALVRQRARARGLPTALGLGLARAERPSRAATRSASTSCSEASLISFSFAAFVAAEATAITATSKRASRRKQPDPCRLSRRSFHLRPATRYPDQGCVDPPSMF